VKITVGPPFFNKVNAPLGLLLLFLTGVGPVIAWRRASGRNLQRNVLVPFTIGLCGGIALFLGGMRHYYALISFSLCFFVLATVFMEFFRGVRARQAMMAEAPHIALARLIGKNRRRYGGYIVHIGIVMMFLAFTGTSAFKQERQITVSPGNSFELGGYTLRYEGVKTEDTPHIAYLLATVAVLEDGELVETLHPEKRFYKKPEQPTTEVAIRSTLGADLYLVLGGYDQDTKMATIQAYVNPLVGFLWYGGLVLAFGTFVTIWPARATAPAPAYVPGSRQRVATK
jgi:cytochrome c-type biogenesis protein CcmF